MKLAPIIHASFLAASAAFAWFGMKAKAESPTEPLKLLRAGGYTIHFRHSRTDFSQNDLPTADAGDCTRQRNLSGEGRDLARSIGTAIATLKIPVGDVRAGPLCRTLETARLIFGRAVSDAEVRGSGLGQNDYAGLRRLISIPVKLGTNQVLVGHGAQFHAVSQMSGVLDEGDAAIKAWARASSRL